MEDRTNLRLDDNEGDARIAAVLRDVYAPPAEGAYWDGLQSRILAYVREHEAAAVIPVNWWSDLASWAGPGLAAAALLFAAAGVIWSRQKDEDMRTSYEAMTEPLASDFLPGAVQVVTAPHDGSSQREATFRYVLSH
ncbi:MAG TPA: hypothetical protein VJ825_07640 [Gemmatimonadaceae bacterium]|nr:hypothetical protein [Gemmatimonadaceae bacterium]